MKKYKALGPNLIIRVDTRKLEKTSGGIYIPEVIKTEQAREEAEIIQLGEDAFTDLKEENRPKVGDFVVIPKYEGRILGRDIEDVVKEKIDDFELRVVSDTRILALIEVNDE
jgi:co-chaperonin GroES (HSP10)